MSEDNGSANQSSLSTGMRSFNVPLVLPGSKAIPIVAPPKSPPPSSNMPHKDSNSPPKTNSKGPTLPSTSAGKSSTLCRNVIIHGYCKFQDKGCEFFHPPNEVETTTTSDVQAGQTIISISDSVSDTSSTTRTKLNVTSKSFTPGGNTGGTKSLSDIAKKAPVFVPKFSTNTTPSQTTTSEETYFNDESSNNAITDLPQEDNELVDLSNQFSGIDLTQNQDFMENLSSFETSHQYLSPSVPQTKTLLESSYYENSEVQNPPLQHHLYQLPLPHVKNLLPHQRTMHQFFVSETLRSDLTSRSEASYQINTDDNLPESVHVYHTLFSLESSREKSSRIFGYPTSVYRATCSVDGLLYALRRVEGFRLTNEIAIHSIEKWRRVKHSSIISVREAYTTRAFGDISIVFAYDFHPKSITLYDTYFTPEAQNGMSMKNLNEQTIWSYIIQLSGALKAIHNNGLAARIVEPSKILVTGKNRIRLNACGIFDVIAYDGGHNTTTFQQEDLLNFGKMIVSLACKSIASVHNLAKSIDFLSKHYSNDLKNVALFLLSKPSPMKTIDEVIKMIGSRIIDEVDRCYNYNDVLENELGRELENSRIARLMMKMGVINERPEFDHDPSWSETGDRYIIKLFRDYVFHSVNERGMPVVDFAHIITCLNKLDAGIDEQIMLVSRDEQSCLIVSYKEVKNCIDAAYRDLSRSIR